eukprot:CAMPEP_0184291650 /NCGR_PEP_ID=MMETSP1049-20130417/3604_1 /TAXON_ID=77928 /ORGANISM="Proteomonas sulcata, Strain CCMP704" /LENGTH=167 /DNA_ID=CAMNT_0026599149 /DNA_START=41 /DNA_END=544 /DNA_ORIENTATION=-
MMIKQRIAQLGGKDLNIKKEKDYAKFKEFEKVAEREILERVYIDGVPLSEEVSIYSLFGFRIIFFPHSLAKWLFFQARWFILFTMMNQPYGRAEQEYVTKRIIKIRPDQWAGMDQEEKDELMERQLWLPENFDVWKQEKKAEEEERHREMAQSNRYKQVKRFMKKYN